MVRSNVFYLIYLRLYINWELSLYFNDSLEVLLKLGFGKE